METNLTSMYAGGTNPDIIGRDAEVEMLMLTLLRSEKPNAVMIGEPGVGKTALVHQLSYLIANGLCPKELKGYQVIEINTNALLSGPGYRGVTEEKFDRMIAKSISSGKTILFFDEFHTIEKLGEMANGQTPGLGNTLKPYLTKPNFRVIGATTLSEFKTITDAALLRRFYPILVSEPTDEAVLNIIEHCYLKYGAGIKFKRSIFKQTLDLSKTMNGFNPDKAKDICDFVCSYARLKAIKEVDNSTIDKVFTRFFSDGKYVPQRDMQKDIIKAEIVE